MPALFALALLLTTSGASSAGWTCHGASTPGHRAPRRESSAVRGVAAFSSAPASADSSIPWTAYFGSQYAAPRWGGAIRFPFQRERDTHDQLLSALPSLAAQYDILLTAGGLGSARDQASVRAYVESVRRDRGQAWRDQVSAFATEVSRAMPQGHHVAWQVGNEINSPTYSRFLPAAENLTPAPGLSNPAIVGPYVEDFLAPTVEALRAADASSYVVLGSVANAFNPRSLDWLNSLLGYHVQGRSAETLRGQSVADLVDIVAIHYLLTGDNANWRSTLDNLYSRWVGTGRIKGIWSTEELGMQAGRSNQGAAVTARIVGRYLDYWLAHDYTPLQGRVFLWGSDLGVEGTRGQDVMRSLVDFLGAAPLTREEANNPDGLELHAFRAVGSNRHVVFIVPRAAGSRLTRITVPAAPGDHAADATLLVYSAGGTQSTTLAGVAQGNRLVFTWGSPVELANGMSAVLQVQPR